MWQECIINWDGITTGKKYWNYGDMNRVESNSQYLSDLIETYNTTVGLIDVVTNRDRTSYDFYDDLNKVESNIQILANMSHEPTGWITPKVDWVSGDTFSYVDTNRLETNLLLLHELINDIIDSLLYCGSPQMVCGRDNTML